MRDLTNRDFYWLSLLSYFDIYDYKEGMPVSSWIISILYDASLKEDFRHDPIFMANLERMKHINIHDYEEFYIDEYHNDNANSGVVFFKIRYGNAMVFAFRGSESYDGIRHTTKWQDWRDNFSMFLDKPSPQQLYVLHYMNQLETDQDIYLCGHSKGGNLAIYTSLCCREEVYERIKKTVSFNAPGMTREIMDLYQFRLNSDAFQEKLDIYENENDCISSFFGNAKEPIIIASTQPAGNMEQLFNCHNLFTIKMSGTDFIYGTKKSIIPQMMDHFINDFFVNLGKERLDHFVEVLDEYFDSDMTIDQLYHIFIYHLGKYTGVFDDMSYEEMKTLEFSTLRARITSYYVKEKLRNFSPKDIRLQLANLKLNSIDIRQILSSTADNMAIGEKEEQDLSSSKVNINNRKITQAIGNLMNRLKRTDES